MSNEGILIDERDVVKFLAIGSTLEDLADKLKESIEITKKLSGQEKKKVCPWKQR